MIKPLLIVAALVAGYFALDSYMTTRNQVKTLTDDNAELTRQLAVSRTQHNTEQAISQQGVTYSQQEADRQEKTRIEIHQQIIREPCAGQPVPDSSAQRLWQLTTETRAAAVSGNALQSDGVTSAAAAGE
ncbi:hypothetical protein [Intestinirhabdus alba]|jgi:hypothetical protein|uniref:DUF2570 domain-containing protein n=1 Tax=Intestinirhabdus alba TaxID=2899544 RepID=A0A6L6ILS7_9ENTR|nr:hypothetical protein [Intestinirhabdus alba]MTH47489.1 hypothetical protein [Intestinirhabdus alba]